MSWHGIEGHDHVVELFRRALRRGRLASSFLFAGPAGIGKTTAAIVLSPLLGFFLAILLVILVLFWLFSGASFPHGRW